MCCQYWEGNYYDTLNMMPQAHELMTNPLEVVIIHEISENDSIWNPHLIFDKNAKSAPAFQLCMLPRPRKSRREPVQMENSFPNRNIVHHQGLYGIHLWPVGIPGKDIFFIDSEKERISVLGWWICKIPIQIVERSFPRLN